MNITIQRTLQANKRQVFKSESPKDRRVGFWGVITEVHPENCTVHVLMDTGREIQDVRVASLEWVTIDDDKDFLSGERHLPPVDTFVFCLMPTGEPSSAFVLCSGFAQDDTSHDFFKQKGAKAASSWQKINNSGWSKIEDYTTGTVTITNKPTQEDATITLNIDQEEKGNEKVQLKVHDNTIDITKDALNFAIAKDANITITGEAKIDITKDANITVQGKASLQVKGDVDIKTKGNANIEATGDATVKSKNTTLTGGNVNINGTVAPTGQGAFCGITACCLTGAPHVGPVAVTQGA